MDDVNQHQLVIKLVRVSIVIRQALVYAAEEVVVKFSCCLGVQRTFAIFIILSLMKRL